VRHWLEQGADPGADGSAALVLAASERNVEVVTLLLAQPSVDPTARAHGALLRAAGCGCEPAVRALLADPRVDPSAHDAAALRYVLDVQSCEPVRAALLGDARVATLVASHGGLDGFKAYARQRERAGSDRVSVWDVEDEEEGAGQGASEGGAGAGGDWQAAVDRAVYANGPPTDDE
jgi:hypothetical protein